GRDRRAAGRALRRLGRRRGRARLSGAAARARRPFRSAGAGPPSCAGRAGGRLRRMSFDWMTAAQRLRAMAQTGLAYATGRFDVERYRELSEIAHDMLAELLGRSPAAVAELFELERGYPTPKVDVRTAVFSEGRVLLVQEWLDGGWTLPGGWADEGDSPREAAERECREESGFEVKVQ